MAVPGVGWKLYVVLEFTGNAVNTNATNNARNKLRPLSVSMQIYTIMHCKVLA